MSRKIFVLGTGRSGTHWLGHILDSHPSISATIEEPRIFRLATRAAIYQEQQRFLVPVLGIMYWNAHRRVRPLHYADKSHPAIWFADRLGRMFSDALFIGIERSPFGTVASMLRHQGVMRWQANWEEYPVPNPFLGVTEENRHIYARMSPTERAALRWRSHHERLARLRDELTGRLLLLKYEDMMDRWPASQRKIWDFVGVAHHPSHRAPRVASRDKWRAELSDEQMNAIAEITGVEIDD